MITGKQLVVGIFCLYVVFGLVSCQSGENPASPSNISMLQSEQNVDQGMNSGRQLWGLWDAYIPPSNDTIEFIPVRDAAFHLNARRFLEETVCQNCLKLISIEKDFTNMVIKAQIQLTHPFPGLARYTAFDVRGVVISNGSTYFPLLDIRVPDATKGDFTLLNPDGWTRLWNTIDFPPGSGPFGILEYSKGKFAAPGGFTATVNPYIEFVQDPRSSFPAGGSITKEFRMTLKPGGAYFGYAVDASWLPPTVDPPVNLMTDFPPSANACEPYVISVYAYDDLIDKTGDTSILDINLADRQEDSFPTGGYLECPDLWSGLKEPMIWGISPGQPLWVEIFTSFDISNEFGVGEGLYPAMIKIMDSTLDPYLGDINHRYHLTMIKVKHVEMPVLSGRIVFVAPGPPDPGGMWAPNVFLLDTATSIETQITNFVGEGVMFEEPRISPDGTHILISMSTTPEYGTVQVYEIGGSNWSVTPTNTYDCHADFSTDSQHILVASGNGYFDTYDLVTMDLDGSNRTLLATAPVSVRNPRWSPDGTRIAFTTQDWSTPLTSASIYIYDVATEEFTELITQQGFMMDHVSWSPVKLLGYYMLVYDYQMYYPVSTFRDLWIINPDTGESQLLCDTGTDEAHPSFSPDGMSVVYSAFNWMGTDLYVYGMLSGESTPLTYDSDMNDSPSWCWEW